MAHTTVARAARHEETIEGSRFLASVASVGHPDEAAELVAEARRQHPEATHHCWAWRIGDQQRFSDDGEPGGTAGRPMLEVILKRELDHVAAVVVRYYGGKKLGAGGLVRAYSGAVAKALDAAGTRQVVEMTTLLVRAPFAHVDGLLRRVDEMVAELRDAARGEAGFDAEGVKLELTVPAAAAPDVMEALAETTRGAAEVSRLDVE